MPNPAASPQAAGSGPASDTLTTPAQAARLLFGNFTFDVRGQQLLRDAKPVTMAPRPLAVLQFLLGRGGQLVTKDELLDAVWGHRHVSDSVLKVAISSLRNTLGDDAAAPRYIETAARRGYRFVARVDALSEVPHAAPPSQPSAAAPEPREPTVSAAGNLPTLAAALVGREAATAELRGLLGTRRLVTLLGPAGIGKTQLALSTARLDAPRDGVWLVRLDALADAAPLLDTVARTLSLGANASRNVQALAQALSPLTLRLVLDNAEHLIDELAPLVAQCLAQAPQVQILVTSQTPLRVVGEVVMPLQALQVPPVGSAADARTFSAVALFIERVRAAQPQFTPDAAITADIVQLCRLLDGLPLALELAAARVPLLGVGGVLARMSDRFALLSRGARDAPERHRTLRAALAWSFGLLDAAQARVLRRLSVFAGTFTAATAQAVAAEPADADWLLLDALQALQDHSLLAADATPGEPRFRLLESVRALASEHLRAAGEEAPLRTRHAHAMLALFTTAQARYTRTPLLHWLAPLRPEADNLRLAMEYALGRLPAPDAAAGDGAALRLAVSLFSQAMLFWLRSGRKREAQWAYAALQPHFAQVAAIELRAALGLAVGALAAYSQSLPPAEALPWLDEAEQSFARLGDGRSAMLALYLHAALMQRVAPTQDRSPLLARMRAFEMPDWSPRERNFAAWTEAVNAHGHGDLIAFRAFCVDDLARARASDDRAEAWIAAFGLGQALWSLGERTAAMNALNDAVEDLRANGLLREHATTAALAASMRVALGETAYSEAAMREAADLVRAEGMLWWMGDALMLLPAWRGQWPQALRLKTWIDDRMHTLGMKRSPVASSLRSSFDVLLAQAREAPQWREPPAVAVATLDDAEVLRLSFG